jgi:multidrug efflux pump subunit AcrA (membrane-fusion protein)
MLGFASYHVVLMARERPATEPPAEPARSPFSDTVACSGLVEAKTENVAIGSTLSGVILEVYTPAEHVGKHVVAGEPLFRVDDRHLKARLALDEANLAAAEAQLAKLEAAPRAEELPPSEAKFRAALADVALLEDKCQRTTKLVLRQAATVEEGVERKLSLEPASNGSRRRGASTPCSRPVPGDPIRRSRVPRSLRPAPRLRSPGLRSSGLWSAPRSRERSSR